MIRIGILGHRFIEWGGGFDFLRMVCASLSVADQATELHLLLPTRGPRTTLHASNLTLRCWAKRLLGRALAPSHAPSVDGMAQLLADSGATVRVHEIDRGATAVKQAFKRLDLDVLMPAFDPLPFRADIPWVGYLYDAQHKHLPQFFSPAELAQRDQDFQQMLAQAQAVIVNARAVATDLRIHFPDGRAEVVALPFSTSPSASWFDCEPAAAQTRHGITGPYFIICNQFWKHKDHGTAFEAFAAIAPAIPNLQLVCTGATSDHRDPLHFAQLQLLLADYGVSDRVHILGLIPKIDQIALMRGAVGLIQPTMFEGGPGGGAVYDAVALGVPCVVSDIPVNLEIDEPNVYFFEARNANSLRKAMDRVFAEATDCKPVPAIELLRRGHNRRKACGNTLIATAMRVIDKNIKTNPKN